jgi:hypothetical protein
MTRRLQLARECLRQVWQIFDAGGHSMGRSEESFLLEAAMTLIESDHRFSSLADSEPEEFCRLVRDEIHKISQAQIKKQDRNLGIMSEGQQPKGANHGLPTS